MSSVEVVAVGTESEVLGTGRPGPDTADVEREVGRVMGDLTGALGVLLISLGTRSGLWTALAGRGPRSVGEVAAEVRTHPALVREWLRAQAAGGYLCYHPDTARFELPDATAAAVLGPAGPMVEACLKMITSMADGFAEFSAAFADGQGFGWHRRTADHWAGSDAFTRLVISPELIRAAIVEVAPVLADGGSVADIGCGYGAPTTAMASVLPSATVWGFDYHDASIMQARASAAGSGVDVRFDVAAATDFPAGPGLGWDLITFFDSLHDLGDPVGALRRAHSTLAPGGAVLLFEPLAADAVADNLTPTGRMFFAISTLVCTPNAVAQEVPGSELLSTQSGERVLRSVARAAGFSRVDRLAVPAPLNLVLALQP